LPTAVTVVEAAPEDLPQHQLLIPTAKILLAGSITLDMTVIITVLIFRQDVPKLVITMRNLKMTIVFFMKDS
jgi:hypothetical protein